MLDGSNGLGVVIVKIVLKTDWYHSGRIHAARLHPTTYNPKKNADRNTGLPR